MAREPIYPSRLRHGVPAWVKAGAVYHIRIRTAAEQAVPLTDPGLADALLQAARLYHESGRWWCRFIVLMPDHLHALVSFPDAADMPDTVRAWKRATARLQGVRWQGNFFDHRLRSEIAADAAWRYFAQNPVKRGLSENADAWPWRWSPNV